MDPLSSRMKNLRNRGMLIAIALLCLAYISDSTHISDLEKVVKRGHLIVLTLQVLPHILKMAMAKTALSMCWQKLCR